MPRPSDPRAKIKLLTAAEAVFVARGLDGAKVEEIAERAGLGKGTFYLHFKTKEDAFRHLVESMVARLTTYLQAVPGECFGTDLTAFLDQWVRQDVQIFEFIWQNRGLMGLLLDGGTSAAYRHLVDQFADAARLQLVGFLARGVALGIYRRDLDVDLTADFIAGAYDRLARKIVRLPRRPDLPSLLRQLQVLVLRGVASADMSSALTCALTPAAVVELHAVATKKVAS